MKYIFFLSILIFSILLLQNSNAQQSSKFYIDGQIHPDYLIKIVVNGKVIKEIIPDKDSVKIFIFDLYKNTIKKGENTVIVEHNVVRSIKEDVGSSRSFRFNIRYQSDIDNNDSVTKLTSIKGPEKPFPKIGTTGEIIEVFEFTPEFLH